MNEHDETPREHAFPPAPASEPRTFADTTGTFADKTNTFAPASEPPAAPADAGKGPCVGPADRENPCGYCHSPPGHPCRAASYEYNKKLRDALAALRAERDRLRAALRAAYKALHDECLSIAQYGEQPEQFLLDAADAARAALAGEAK